MMDRGQTPITQEDRQLVLAAADALLSERLAPTPSNVILRLGGRSISAAHVRTILKHRKKFGKSTETFRQSEADFERFAEPWRDAAATPVHMAHLSLRVFTWALVLTPFLAELASMKEAGRLEGLYLAAGWTWRVDLLGFSTLASKQLRLVVRW
jgi:hypothetical protein